MFWAEIWKISIFFLSENGQVLEIRFSTYLNRHVFVTEDWSDWVDDQAELCLRLAHMSFSYAPNFKEVRGTYCFWFVHPCVRVLRFLMHSITSEPCMQGFWNFIYGFLMKKKKKKKNSWHIFFLIRIMPLSWVMALRKNLNKNLSAKYLKNLLKIEPWNLRIRLVAMSGCPD